jgi:O-antigen biosynthesis protein
MDDPTLPPETQDLATLLADSEARLRAAQRRAATAEALARAHADRAARFAVLAEEQSRLLVQLRQSTSWKLTRPLRLLSHIARGRWDVVGTGLRRLRHGAPPAAMMSLADPIPPPDLAWVPSAAAPLVSIIIPSYGQVAYTRRCLASIAAHPLDVPVEIIVADDASHDPDLAALKDIEGLRLLVWPRNQGFLLSCNQAARHASGRFLCLLNNDTEVTEGWLDALLDVYRQHPNAGLVGARLLYPDGRLQEAGGIVWNDASAWNFGNRDDPTRGAYNYVRAVDYCSAAAVLIDRDLWDRLGGFDERYVPAYYEDTDFAFRVRAAGRDVLYAPRAAVVHHEGVSHGTDLSSGIKAHQAINRQRFLERWGDVLAREHFANGTHLLRARDRNPHGRVALVVDHYVPQPDRDAGSRAMVLAIDAFLAGGYTVKFWPQNGHRDPVYSPKLEQRGVEILAAPRDSFAAWMRRNGADLSVVLLSRPSVAPACLPAVRAHSRARIVYYGHDLHAERLRREARVTGRLRPRYVAWRVARRERALWKSADVTAYFSDDETAQVRRAVPRAHAVTVPAYAYDDFPDRPTAPACHDVLFVAGFAHPPNVDAAIWLVQEIWPGIRARVADARLLLIGSHPTDAVRGLQAGDITVTGFVSDAALRQYYAQARVALVPLRFGAGVKSKVVEALREGLPLVTTSVGLQGVAGARAIVPMHDDAAGLATATIELLTNDNAWQLQAAAQSKLARAEFGLDAALKRILSALTVES